MIKIEVNNRLIDAMENETILSALKREGITVPTLCHVEGLLPSGACRMCVVELENTGRLIPSCSFPVQEGMRIKTHSPKAIDARRTIVELLLADHPDDCLYCARNGCCELQKLAENLGVRVRRYTGSRVDYHVDLSSPAIIRTQEKCILCGKCVRICEEIQGVSAIDFAKRGSSAIIATAFNESLNVSSCVSCGQCTAVCPTGALVEHSQIEEVVSALNDPEKIVVIQHAPAVSVSLAEEFGLKPGTDVQGIMTAALRKMGFDRVFDTAFSADVTIMEEASELIERIKSGGPLPLITSCSPAWVKFAETFYPGFLPNISTCKSPQQMLGAIIKSYWVEKEKIDPAKVFSVAVMPCTAKKFEATRPELADAGYAEIDAVLTTRELAKMIRRYGIEFAGLEPEVNDLPFGTRSSAAKLFAGSGGVMEAALRTASNLLTGTDLKQVKIKPARGLEGIKEFKFKIGDLELGCVVLSGLKNARIILDQMKAGRDDIHFIEIMSCPGGCINGGGQPIGVNKENVAARLQALYKIDMGEYTRMSHQNPAVQDLYRDYLGKPNSHKAHELLHTHYEERDILLK
ncbi:MAG: NADH-dependent [FeFe] hydrogenase, group A6 [Clostridiales bacterium]